MKTAVSIPDDTFYVAEQVAAKLGTTRSKLYATALQVYLKQQADQEITDKLNEVYKTESSELDPILKAAQYRILGKEDW